MIRLKRIWHRLALIVLLPDHVMGIAPVVQDDQHLSVEPAVTNELPCHVAQISESHSSSGA